MKRPYRPGPLERFCNEWSLELAVLIVLACLAFLYVLKRYGWDRHAPPLPEEPIQVLPYVDEERGRVHEPMLLLRKEC